MVLGCFSCVCCFVAVSVVIWQLKSTDFDWWHVIRENCSSGERFCWKYMKINYKRIYSLQWCAHAFVLCFLKHVTQFDSDSLGFKKMFFILGEVRVLVDNQVEHLSSCGSLWLPFSIILWGLLKEIKFLKSDGISNSPILQCSKTHFGDGETEMKQ